MACLPLDAQTAKDVTYTLLDGSQLLDDCLICGRPTLIYSLRGTFTLTPLDNNMLFARYRLTNIAFKAGPTADMTYDISGTGVYRIGGEVALVQGMTLDLKLNDRFLVFTNNQSSLDRQFPLIDISVAQTQVNLAQFFSIHLVAAPVREIWFSTASGFTSAFHDLRGSPGDLLSATGRIVTSSSNLVAQLGLAPGVDPRGIDALDLGPGAEIFFSFDQNQNSATLGLIHHGDLVSNQGRIVQSNQMLTSAFGIMPSAPEVGLDAVTVKDDGEVLFSIRTDVFSERLGQTLQKGDVLSDRGRIVRRNAELLSRFHPNGQKDYGLDALYVWPHGEIWFSTEEDFQDLELGPILAGDLLSDQGVIVFHNLELLSAFAPLEDLADFGLDGLFVITDLAPPAPPPIWTQIQRWLPDRTMALRWTGSGRVFRVDKAADIAGPYLPCSPLLPGLMFDDLGAGTNADQSFYRLRQW